MSEETKKIEFNQDEYKKAVLIFNEYLKENGKPEIVWEGLEEGQQITNFLAPIIEEIETGNAGNLPIEVIDYYNNNLAEEDDEDETEKPAKEEKSSKKKTKKKPKEKKESDGTKPWQKPIGKEKLVYELVKQGKSDKEIRKIIEEMYEGHPDPDFVEWRIYTYMVKGKNFLAKEDPKFAEKWAEDKKKIKRVPHPSKKKTPEELAKIEELKKKKAEEKKAKKAEEKAKKAEERKKKAEEKKATKKSSKKGKTSKTKDTPNQEKNKKKE